MLVDSHAHLEMPQFEEDLPQVLQRARDWGIRAIVTCGTHLQDSRRAVDLAAEHPEVFASVGIHPHEANTFSPDTLASLKDLALHPKVVAIGEMGLDFYRELSPRKVQIEAFRAQIRLAKEMGKPVIVHAREAQSTVLKILEEEGGGEVRGVLHCFSGNTAMATKCLDMGLFISIPGVITFKNSAQLRNVVLHVPLDRLLLETDSPFLAPIPFRGKRNEPAFLRYTAQKVAKVLKVTVEEVAEKTTRNAMSLFGLALDGELEPGRGSQGGCPWPRP
jgi:TatD DNase family protein